MSECRETSCKFVHYPEAKITLAGSHTIHLSKWNEDGLLSALGEIMERGRLKYRGRVRRNNQEYDNAISEPRDG
jgi:hypothetical protein